MSNDKKYKYLEKDGLHLRVKGEYLTPSERLNIKKIILTEFLTEVASNIEAISENADILLELSKRIDHLHARLVKIEQKDI